MVSAYANPLEAALDKLAVDTWRRLQDIRAFSRRPEPFNSVRFGETTITDLSMLELCRVGLSRSIFLQTPAHKEVFWGADFEWWLGSTTTGWFRLAVQAKKLDMRRSRYISLAHKPNGLLQINTLEQYAHQNRATPLYCLYNYSGGVDGSRHWHCCQRPFREEELGCSLTRLSRVREAICRRGMRTFDFIHRWSSTLPWRCMASCPKVRDTFQNVRETSGSQIEDHPVEPFPLIDPRSYYPTLPPFHSQSRLGTLTTGIQGDLASQEMPGYAMEVVPYDDRLAEYYNLDVGIPRGINVTDLDL